MRNRKLLNYTEYITEHKEEIEHSYDHSMSFDLWKFKCFSDYLTITHNRMNKTLPEAELENWLDIVLGRRR